MSETTRSDRDYIVSNASSISSSVTSASVNGGVSSVSFNSTSKCPSMEPGVVETLLGSCKELFRRIADEATTVSKVGDGFVKLDNVMACHASSLNMDIKSKCYEVGSVALAEDKDSDVPSNDEIRKEIEGILAEKGSDWKLKDRSKEKENDDDDRDYGYTPYSSGSYSSGSPAPSSSTPEKTTNPVPAETFTEPVTQPQGDVIEDSPVLGGGEQKEPQKPKPEIITIPPQQAVPLSAKTETKPTVKPVKKYINGTDTYEPVQQETTQTPVDEPFIEETPEIIEEPIIEDYNEPALEIPEDKLVVEQINSDQINITEEPTANKSGNGLKTAAAVIGVGAALGAAGYGVSKVLKEKEEQDESDDYGWESEV